MQLYDTVIVGGGLAGYTAALTAKNLKLDSLWLADGVFGRNLRLAERVTDFPSVMGSGRDFARALDAQREAEDIRFLSCRVDGVYPAEGAYLTTAGEQAFRSRTVILATGVERRAALKGAEEFLGKGVSYCAVCDAALYRGKRVAAVLYDEGFEDELTLLASYADTVGVFGPCRELPPHCVPVRGTPLAVEGDKRVSRLLHTEGTFETDGVFLLGGTVPPGLLVRGLRTDGPHIVVARDLSTNLAGIFAAGDVTGTPYQYAKAAGEGCVAAHSARSFLKNRPHP